jgi:uncharacterized protein (TIGR03086 family)
MSIDIGPAAQRMAEVVTGVPEGLLDAPTPCPSYTLGDLLDHVGDLAVGFTLAAKKLPTGDSRPPANAEDLGDDWRTRIPQELDDLAAAWRDPSAWDGMTNAGGIEMPGAFCGVVVLDELVIHAWDVAKATGQPYEPPDAELLQAVLGFVEESAKPEAAPMREGLFGPVVEIPEDAPLFDRILGLAGRDPDWSPPT